MHTNCLNLKNWKSPLGHLPPKAIREEYALGIVMPIPSLKDPYADKAYVKVNIYTTQNYLMMNIKIIWYFCYELNLTKYVVFSLIQEQQGVQDPFLGVWKLSKDRFGVDLQHHLIGWQTVLQVAQISKGLKSVDYVNPEKVLKIILWEFI